MAKPTKILILCALLAGAGGAGLLLLLSSNEPPPPADVDLESVRSLPYIQWTERRANKKLRGVTVFDEARAHQGYNLYTNDADEVYLMDMKGRRVHTWNLPGRKQCEYGKLTDTGDVLVVCVDEALVKLDWQSRVLWEAAIRAHHDVAILPDSQLLAWNRDNAVRYVTYKVEFDSILRLSDSGKVVDRWSTFENLEKLKRFHPASPLDTPRDRKNKEKEEFLFFDYYHMNALELLPETELGKRDPRFRAGNLLICSRHLDWIAVLDQTTREVVWSWGPGVLDGPHNPTLLPNGRILIFDNGTRRGWSRLVEIDPSKGDVLWEYKGDPPKSFFSAWRGSCQRLANGNTLVTNSESGHAFELSPDNKVVWEFWNPEIRKGKRKRIYRMVRLEESQVAPLLQEHNLH